MEARARILITGLVQGVFFRREMTELATRLGISGWVRNLPDGKVEALAEGERARLDELIRFCHVGPREAIRESSEDSGSRNEKAGSISKVSTRKIGVVF